MLEKRGRKEHIFGGNVNYTNIMDIRKDNGSVKIKEQSKKNIWPDIPLLGLYLKKSKLLGNRDISIPMFTVAVMEST